MQQKFDLFSLPATDLSLPNKNEGWTLSIFLSLTHTQYGINLLADFPKTNYINFSVPTFVMLVIRNLSERFFMTELWDLGQI